MSGFERQLSGASSFQIIGSHNGEMVALPVPFPSPAIDLCLVRHVNIIVDNVEERHVAIISPQGTVYELSRRMKEAIFGAVHFGIVLTPASNGSQNYIRSDFFVAIKIVSKEKLRLLRNKCQEDPLKEFAAMQYISKHPLGRHENIVLQLECLQDEKHYFSILEFVQGGELFDYVEDNGAMPETVVQPLISQILSGLGHLRNMNICHRDISLENIMLTNDGVVKIIDFGMALLLPRHPDTQKLCLIPRQGQCGKRNYMAPEVVENLQPFNGHLVDLWAVGIILFILLTGAPPCETASPLDSRYRMVASSRVGEMLQNWGMAIPADTVAFIESILKHVPSERASVEQVLQAAWLTIPRPS